jgi:L-ascorbate metabolism protein UlaG (beta-lactamase superfamily)
MEITWYGGACLRLKGREGTIAADAYRSVVGPTGRGLTADIVTYSHPDPNLDAARGRKRTAAMGGGVALPTSLEAAFVLAGPGEFEVHDVLVTGVRTFRDEARGAERGPNVAFVYELDGLHAVHLGDIGHALTEATLGEIGTVDVVCVPIGGNLTVARASELVSQLDTNLVVVMPVCERESDCDAAMARFLHEMGVAQVPAAQGKLTVSISSVPQELTVVLLESRGKS